MPRMKWDKLNQRQLGQYGEYYAKMEFASYGYDVYTSEVDDHGVDFVARDIVTGTFMKSTNYFREGGEACACIKIIEYGITG